MTSSPSSVVVDVSANAVAAALPKWLSEAIWDWAEKAFDGRTFSTVTINCGEIASGGYGGAALIVLTK